MPRPSIILLLAAGMAPAAPPAQDYRPPATSAALLASVDFGAAAPLDAAYHGQFTACDGSAPGAVGRDRFAGVDLRLPDVPESRQYYLCSRDPSNVRALLRLRDGAILWDSKMALDVDGSWAAWNGLPGATDQKHTSYKWPGSRNRDAREAQLDPDRIPFVVIPTNGVSKLSGAAAPALGRAFSEKTGLALGDMGVAIYRDRWTPVLIGDGGPFMRLGEGSSRVFEALGESRCRLWDAAGTTCVGPGRAYPYRNSGIGSGVVFIVYPRSRDPGLTPGNAIARLCAFARSKLGLTGGSTCPTS